MVVVIQFKYEVIVLASTEIAGVDIAMGIPYTFISLKHFVRRFRQSPLDSLYKCPVMQSHDDVIKWKDFPRNWPFLRGIHRSPVNSPHKGQWRGALMFTLICARINGWVNTREAGDLRRYRTHYDVIVMYDAFFVIRLSKRLNKQ